MERNYKYELLTEHDLGVTIDLILPETYEIDMTDSLEKLDPTDEKLLEEELNQGQEKKRNMKHSQVCHDVHYFMYDLLPHLIVSCVEDSLTINAPVL